MKDRAAVITHKASKRQHHGHVAQIVALAPVTADMSEESFYLDPKVSTSCHMKKSFHGVLLDVKWGHNRELHDCITEMLFLISSLYKLW